MRLFVARHGETLWNAENRICGLTDIDLTEKGLRQAGKLSEDKRIGDVDIIISSPLKRAVATANTARGTRNIPVIIDNRLVEQNYGIYEGADRKTPRFLENKGNFAFKYPGGESMLQLGQRVYNLLDELKEKYSDKTVLLVCHGGVARMIRTYFEDMTNREFVSYSPENCSISEYTL